MSPRAKRKLTLNCSLMRLNQPWAGSPGGDKIPTKIGSGRVEIEIRMAYPDFRTNLDRVEITVLKIPGTKSGKIEIFLYFSRHF